MEQRNKPRILYILKLLYENTDEDNPVSTVDIIHYLSEFGISAHRKTISLDIEILQDFGIDVVVIKSTQNKYFIGDRRFELPELKLLIDAVESSKFITTKKSEELVAKLASLASRNQAAFLNRQLYMESRIKPENETIYYNVDTIHNAINDKKQIVFQYYEYTQAKQKVLKHDGYVYNLSPYALSWNDDHYYVIGYCLKHEKVSTFRVDRMVKPKILDADSIPQPDDFNVADFSKKVFEMFDGEPVRVKLKCTNDLMDVIIDRFGEDIDTDILDEKHFKVTVDVSVSPTFYGWVFQFAGKMNILSPENIQAEFTKMASLVKMD